MVEVIKRDGEKQQFNPTKISDAIGKAMLETKDGVDSHVIYEIVDLIDETLSTSKEQVTTVEDIQDMVETLLMEKRPDVAKKYILYRNKRTEARNQPWKMDELQHSIWINKYNYQKKETFDEWIERVSGGNKRIAKRIRNKQFLFGGRILSNRGLHKKGLKVTYSNCYVLNPPQDNIESIWDTARNMARTYSYGGGVGISLRNLRPRDARVHNNARTTSGAVSFMPLYSLTTETIGQNGRRGALMLSIPSNHPDLEEFIDIKTKNGVVTGANISIEISDYFMVAVKHGHPYKLSFTVKDTGEVIEKEVDARALFSKIAKNNWDWAEPGALFWDRISNWHLMSSAEWFEFAGTNPCAEEPLPPGGSCLLGSLNLEAFVVQPFTDKAFFDYNQFVEAVHDGVEALNEVLDEGLELHPLAEQRESVRDLRQIGLGVMGIGEMLIKMGMAYGSEKSLALMDVISHVLIVESVRKSALLAKEHGSFGKYNWDEIKQSQFFQHNIPTDVKELVKECGLRNSQLLCIAPTGSISTMIGVSGGIEPIFAFGYNRTTKSLHGEDVTYRVYTGIVKEFMELKGLTDESELPDYFITAHHLDAKQRILVQAVWQSHIDASISSTLNLDNKITPEEVEDIYMFAWEMGLKGCTIYRDGCKRAGILTLDEDAPKEQEVKEEKITEGFYASCPECKQEGTMVMSNGCATCTSCGFSPCS